MTSHERALPPIEPEPGVLVHPYADRRLATEHWLLSTLETTDSRARARGEWKDHGVALLPLGGLFSAVRIPADLVQAVAASTRPDDIDTFLADALNGGPVICDLHQARYYALVPASVPRTWRQAADDWRVQDVDTLGRGTHLGVPRLDATTYAGPFVSYWSVPMPSMAVLCPPLAVARLIADGVHQLAEAEPVERVGLRLAGARSASTADDSRRGG
jgi:hypothetical protein